MKGKSFKVFYILFIYFVQLLAFLLIVDELATIESEIVVLIAIVAFIPLSLVFGNTDRRWAIWDAKLNALKCVGLIVCSGCYRFSYFELRSEQMMWELFAIKVAYKVVMVIFGLLFVDKFMRIVRKKVDFVGVTSVLDHEQAKEIYYSGFTRYQFEKMLVVQISDMFFTMSSMVMLWASLDLSGNLDVDL